MRGETIGDGLAEGGKAISWVMAGWLIFRVCQWLFDFLAGRFDRRQANLDAQQELVDGKMVNRLRKLEAQVAVLDQVSTKLIAIVREIQPDHPGLAEVHALLARNLRRATPIEPDLPDNMEQLLRRLDDVE